MRIWLTPIYPSPLADWRYDITDFPTRSPRSPADLRDVGLCWSRPHIHGIRRVLDLGG